MTKTKLKRIAKTKSITHCYIKKGSYYRPNSSGYTDLITRAGIYTKEKAINHAELCPEITLIPVKMAEHNSYIMEEVKDLLSRIII